MKKLNLIINSFKAFLAIALFFLGSSSLTAQHCPAGQVEVFFNLTGNVGAGVPKVIINTDRANPFADLIINMYDADNTGASGTDGWYQCSACLDENVQVWYLYAYGNGTWESADLLTAFGAAGCAGDNSWEGNPCVECPIRGNVGNNFAQRVLDVGDVPMNVHETIAECPSARTGTSSPTFTPFVNFTHYEVRDIQALPNQLDNITATDRTENPDGWVTFWNDNGTATDFSDDYILYSIENDFLNVNGTYQHWNLQYNRATVNTPAFALAQWHASDPATFINNPSGGAARMTRLWDYDWSTALPAATGVRFYYTQAEFDEVNTIITGNGGTALADESEMALYKVTSGEFPWNIPVLAPEDVQLIDYNGGATSVSEFDYQTVGGGNTTKYFQFEVAGFSGGGGGGVSGGGSFLPVELTEFKGVPADKEVKLAWTTATEIENDFFELEHSTDRRDFSVIGKVSGSGNTYSTTDYGFMHENPRNGVNYYRLVSVAFDGTRDYSDVISVSFENNGKLTVYPSVVSGDYLNINFQGENAQVSVFNQTGQTVLIQTLDMTSGSNRIQTTDLPTGVYYLTVQDNNIRETVKFVRQ